MWKKVMVIACILFSCKESKQPVSDSSPKAFTYNNKTALTQYNYHQKQFRSQEEGIRFDSKEGMKLFFEADYKDDFFRLSQYFAGQRYMSTCGAASLRIVLSALYAKMEKTPVLDKEHSLVAKDNGIDYFIFKFTEENIFDYIESDSDYERYDVIARKAKTKNGGYGSGMGGENIVNVAKSHAGITAKYTVANRDSVAITQGEFKKLVDKNLDCTHDCDVLKSRRNDKAITLGIKQFRADIKKTLESSSQFMIAYYSHVKTVPGRFSGHFSPLVAFNSKEDKVLIMDVASHLGGWYWVTVSDLYKSMSYDLGASDRGYIVVGLKEDKK